MVASVLAARPGWVEPIPAARLWQAMEEAARAAAGNAWTMGAGPQRLDYDLRNSYY
jgi:hypothetical protein